MKLGLGLGLATLLSLPDDDLWAPVYIKYEMSLLQALGYGLDLSRCASGNGADDLAYVSPRTGHAVSRIAKCFISCERSHAWHGYAFPDRLCSTLEPNGKRINSVSFSFNVL